jgi:phasin
MADTTGIRRTHKKEDNMGNGGMKPTFEIPAEMRAMAEKGVEQAKQAFEGLLAATQQAALTAGTQFTSMQTGARETGELAMRFAERNVASAFDFAEKLVRAKDPQEVAKLHADYARSQMEALSEQAKEIGQKAAKLGRAD